MEEIFKLIGEVTRDSEDENVSLSVKPLYDPLLKTMAWVALITNDDGSPLCDRRGEKFLSAMGATPEYALSVLNEKCSVKQES